MAARWEACKGAGPRDTARPRVSHARLAATEAFQCLGVAFLGKLELPDLYIK